MYTKNVGLSRMILEEAATFFCSKEDSRLLIIMIVSLQGEKHMATVFSKIISGELPSHKILENESYLAFLNINPVNPGHTLVIPKKEIDYIFDLEDELLAGLMVFSKKIAEVIKLAVPCKRIGVMVAGLEVPHAHVHLIPILQSLEELNFARARKSSEEELSGMAQKIRKNL